MAYPSVPDPGSAGLRGRCPRCGQGQLFAGYLRLRPTCSVCGLDLGFADSGDGPAFFVMSITGLVAVVVVFVLLALGVVAGAAIIAGMLVSVALALAMLRPAKGLLIGLQYKNDAAEGRIE